MDRERAESLRKIASEMKLPAPAESQTVRDPQIGDCVKILDGPFQDFHGVVETVDNGMQRVKVVCQFFGRLTAVELDFAQVERAMRA